MGSWPADRLESPGAAGRVEAEHAPQSVVGAALAGIALIISVTLLATHLGQCNSRCNNTSAFPPVASPPTEPLTTTPPAPTTTQKAATTTPKALTTGHQAPATTHHAPATTHQAPTTSAAPPPAASPGVVLTAAGTGVGLVTVLDNEKESQQSDVPLPWTTTLHDKPSITGLGVQTSDGSSTAVVTCTIDVPGSPPVTKTSTGAYALVDCSADPGL